MKHIFLLIVFTLLAYFSNAQCVADSAEVYKTYTAKELREDLAFLVTKIEKVHANPFANRTKADFKKEVAEIHRKLQNGLTKKDFFLLVAPLIGKLEDDIAFIQEYCITEKQKKQIKNFPLVFHDRAGKVLLSLNGSSNSSLKLGEELIAINDVPIQEIIQKCSEYARGNKLEQRKKVINNLGFFLTYYYFQWKDSYDFTFSFGKTYHISDVSVEEYNKNRYLHTDINPAAKIDENSSSQLINYKTYKTNGYLTINLFYISNHYSNKLFEEEMKKVFTLIQKDSIKHLFVNIKQYSKVNLSIYSILLNYFSTKPIKLFGGTWRKSKDYLIFLNKLGFTNETYKKTKLGKNYIIPSNYTTPNANPLCFTDKIYFFVHDYTFEEIIRFAAILQDNKIATIIGEKPQNAYVNHIGEIINFTMPHTKLEFAFGVKEFIRPSGDVNARELIPDIQIDIENMTIEEIMKKVGG